MKPDQFETLPAIVYSPAGEYVAATARCIDHCNRCGYKLIGVVKDWPAVQRMLDNRSALVVVVDRLGDLPADRLPRVDLVSEFAPRPRDVRRNAVPQRMTRTRRITRRGAGG